MYKFAIVFKPKSVNAGPDLDPEQQTATYFAIFNVVRSELEQKKRLLCFIVTHYFPLLMPLFPLKIQINLLIHKINIGGEACPLCSLIRN